MFFAKGKQYRIGRMDANRATKEGRVGSSATLKRRNASPGIYHIDWICGLFHCVTVPVERKCLHENIISHDEERTTIVMVWSSLDGCNPSSTMDHNRHGRGFLEDVLKGSAGGRTMVEALSNTSLACRRPGWMDDIWLRRFGGEMNCLSSTLPGYNCSRWTCRTGVTVQIVASLQRQCEPATRDRWPRSTAVSLSFPERNLDAHGL